jgi:RNA polymerase sigma-70 factor, ECF subfamily
VLVVGNSRRNAHGRSGDDVVAGARRGEPWAVRAVFEMLHPRLSRFFRAVEPSAADDLTAEVWEAIARGIGTFDGDEAHLRTWAFVIARNRLADHRRRAMRRPVVPLDVSTLDALVADEQPERDALARLSGADAAALLARLLSPEQTEVVLLRVVADLDAATVAAAMGRTETWVRVTQHRALRRLADRLGARSDVTP